MNDTNWIECAKQLPPEHQIVATVIDDDKGRRNEQTLKRIGGLWFVPDGSMYVYYCPTHWRAASREELERVRNEHQARVDSEQRAIDAVDRQIEQIELEGQRAA